MKKMLLACCCLLGSLGLFAQTAACLSQPIPADTSVVIGKLPNGLTYYIKHNDYIPQRADFYIVQKVGAIQEEPAQRGLAHFLEHKLFSQKDGSAMDKFAEMVSSSNAYTSFTHTSYLFSCTNGFAGSNILTAP